MSIESHETYLASIEIEEGITKQHGFHLGTDEQIACNICENLYKNRVLYGNPVVTVALKRNGKMVDCFMGDRWQNAG